VNRNGPAPDTSVVAVPPAILPAAEPGDSARRSLDAPGPVILPGRVAAAPPQRPLASTTNSAVSGATGRSSETLADASPQLRDLTQPAQPAIDQPPVAPVRRTSTTGETPNPVYGLFDHQPGATRPDAGHSQSGNTLASLDRTKVMSFQFRNAPWSVVLSEFATETHLELRMQAIPHGVFNRMDPAKYSPSQTLAILNSELARTGCMLKLEGNVLKVCALSTSTASAVSTTTNRPTPATPSTSRWFPPQSSGIVPVSGQN
jgi:hypothetical protein